MRDYPILLAEFDEVIAERGLHYYETGRVMDVEETAPGCFAAIVSGTEDYEVAIAFDEHSGADYDCDCPYDGAPWCKHVAAVLYALDAGDYRPWKPDPKEPPLTQDTLAKRSSAELAELLCEAATEFPQLRAWLLARLIEPGESLEDWRTLLRSALRAYRKDGFVPYRSVDKALAGARRALEHLRRMADPPGDPLPAMDFAFMLMEELHAVYDDLDDADGMVSYLSGEAEEILHALTEERLVPAGEAVIQAGWRRLMTFVKNPAQSGWSSRLPEDCERLADALPSLRPEYEAWLLAQVNAPRNVYRIHAWEQAALRYYGALARWHGEEAAFAFAQAHPENNGLQEALFQQCCRNGQWQQALDLCLAAEKRHGSCSGLTHQWQDRRYQLYEQSGDLSRLREMARELLLSGRNEYYPRYKALCPADGWPNTYKRLLSDVQALPHASAPATYVHILREEGDESRLLTFVQKNPQTVFRLYHDLTPEHADELRPLFQSELERMARAATGRPDYQRLCEHILIFRNVCGLEAALELVAGLAPRYPRRKAMQDELQRLRQRITGDRDRARTR